MNKWILENARKEIKKEKKKIAIGDIMGTITERVESISSIELSSEDEEYIKSRYK